ncbi:MAG: zinc ABC transporter substrate-binding protein [Pseudomonadota bacterium]
MWKPLAVALTMFAAPALAAPPEVVVTIQPLHSLVAGVMHGVGAPRLLVQGGASPHDFALKPSDARLLSGAGLVVLADEGLESFLAKPLKTIAGKAEVIEMSALPGMTLLPRREGGVWEEEEEEEEHGHGHDHEDGHKHGHADQDPHLWLDPANAMALVKAVAETLGRMDPANAGAYAASAARLTAELQALDGRLRERLAPVAGSPYVVFHDAYQYVEHRYGLAPAGAVTLDPEHPPSAKRLAGLRDRLKAANVRCVFREPQFPAAVVGRLADSAGARVAVLDPLGTGAYTPMMEALAGNLAQCLSGK